MHIFGSSMKRKRETPSSSCSKPKPAKAFSESTDEEEAAEDLGQELQSLYTSGNCKSFQRDFQNRLRNQRALYQELAASKNISQAWQKQNTKRKRFESCRKQECSQDMAKMAEETKCLGVFVLGRHTHAKPQDERGSLWEASVFVTP